MNFTEEHFVSEEAFAEFEHGKKWFYSELVRLNTTIYILVQLDQFPFTLFSKGENVFFNIVVWNFFETALLIVSRLMIDKSTVRHPTHCFFDFQKRLEKDWIKPEYHLALNEYLRSARIDTFTREALSRTDAIRDKYIAHLTRDYILGVTHLKGMDLSDLIELRDRANTLFEALTLRNDTEYLMVPLEYSSTVTWPVGTDPRPDIEQILDDLVKRSTLLNMPEDNPVRWQFHREKLSEAELAQINHYRRKFELPEV
jgi:hypothetical protein